MNSLVKWHFWTAPQPPRNRPAIPRNPSTSLHILLPHHQGIIIMVKLEIPMFIAEEIGVAALGGIDIGKITKIKTTLEQIFPFDLVFAGGIHSREDTSVFAQGIIDIPHKIIDVAILLVMPG